MASCFNHAHNRANRDCGASGIAASDDDEDITLSVFGEDEDGFGSAGLPKGVFVDEDDEENRRDGRGERYGVYSVMEMGMEMGFWYRLVKDATGDVRQFDSLSDLLETDIRDGDIDALVWDGIEGNDKAEQ